MGGFWFWAAIVYVLLTANLWVEWRIAMLAPPWDGDEP